MVHFPPRFHANVLGVGNEQGKTARTSWRRGVTTHQKKKTALVPYKCPVQYDVVRARVVLVVVVWYGDFVIPHFQNPNFVNRDRTYGLTRTFTAVCSLEYNRMTR